MTSLLISQCALICTIHNTIECGRWLEHAYRLTDRLATLNTAICRAAAECYRRIGAARRPRMVPNGIDTSHFRPDDDRRRAVRDALGLGAEFVWLASGRLVEQKDCATLLEAFHRLHDSASVLLIAGEGALRASLQAQAEQLGIAGRVRFLGFCADLAGLMNAADGYAMSSRWEGLPLALLEAAASGLPIVATDAGGNGELVSDKEGFLVPPADPSSLAAAMERLMALPAGRRAAMSAAARNRVVRDYSVEIVVTEWEKIYREAIILRNGAINTGSQPDSGSFRGDGGHKPQPHI